MRRVLVTLETDGLRDFVRLPNGERKTMGSVSILKFVTQAVSRGDARRVLDAFNTHGSVVVSADLDAMEEVLKPVVSRWGSSGLLAKPLIPHSNRAHERAEGPENMADVKVVLDRLGRIEGLVTKMDKHGSEGLIAPKLHEELRSLVGGLHFYDPGDQSKNDAWYIDTPPKVDTVDKGSTTPVHAQGAKTASDAAPVPPASYDTLVQNTELADTTLGLLEETNTKVDALVTASRNFNASKAKEDLYAVASKVTDILNSVDLAQPWVRDDLTALAKQAKQLHGLFASAKV